MNRKPEKKETATYSLSSVLGILVTACTLILGLVSIANILRESADLRSQLATLERENRKINDNSARLYDLIVSALKDGKVSAEALKPFFVEKYNQDRQSIYSIPATGYQIDPLKENIVNGPLITTKPLN